MQKRLKSVRTFFSRLYEPPGKKHHKALFDELMRTKAVAPTFTTVTLVAYIFAAIVHLFTLTVLLSGLVLLITHRDNWFAVVGGLLCLAIAWELRPRFGKLPKDDIAPKDQFPELYRLVDDVAAVLNARPIDYIVVDEQYNASFSQRGIRRKSVLTLGLPLWSILNDQEKVALIGHELAHSVNGDVERGLIISSATNALSSWFYFINPNYYELRRNGLLVIFMFPVLIPMFALANLAKLAAYSLMRLMWRRSRRAEYWADYLGATVGGTDAMLGQLWKLQFSNVFYFTLHQMVVNGYTKRNLFEELKKQKFDTSSLRTEPPKPLDKVKVFPWQTTHPPREYRIEFLKANSVSDPRVILAPVDAQLIDKEIATRQQEIQTRLFDMQEAQLYRRSR